MHLLVVFSSNHFELSCFDEFCCEKLPADHFWLNRGYLLAECSSILFLFIKALYREYIENIIYIYYHIIIILYNIYYIILYI